jgi:molecular chaperone GrpE
MQQNPKTEAEGKEQIKEALKESTLNPGTAKATAQDKNNIDQNIGKDKQIAELTDLAKRVQADFENYKKRAEKESHNQLKLGKALLIKRLLPVLDTFEDALNHNPQDAGLKLVHQQLISALEAEGLKEIKTEGKLDPYRHECLEEECSTKDKGIITDEIRKGYQLDDCIIRHSLVKVSSGKKEEAGK